MYRKREESNQAESFSEALLRFREKYNDALEDLADAFEDVRDHSPGRELPRWWLEDDLANNSDTESKTR
jgi:hypothetical protein